MRRGRRFTRVLAPVFLLLIGAGALPLAAGVAGAADAADPCAVAQAFSDAGRIEAALAEYDGDARTCADRDAKVTALNTRRATRTKELATAAAELELAKAAATRADKKVHQQLARLAFVQALAADAASADAIKGIAALDAVSSGDPFAGSRALVAAELKEEAKAQLLKEIAEGNTLGNSPRNRDLRELLEDDTSDFEKLRSDGTDFIDDAKWVLSSLAWIAGLVIGVVLFGVLAWVVFNFLVLEPQRRRKTHRRAKPGAWRGTRTWRSLTQPRLNVEAGEGDTAKVLAARVRTAILKLDNGNGTSDLRLASMPEESLDLAPLGDIDARVKPILAALKLGGMRDTVKVSLSAEKDDGTHTRVAVEAFARRTHRRSETFVDKADDGYLTPELVGRATAWALFSAEAMRARLRDGEPTTLVYGTKNVDSYGYMLGAVEQINAGEIALARPLLVKAVEADPDFRRAQLNLGVVETMLSDPSVQRLGRARLRALIEEGS